MSDLLGRSPLENEMWLLIDDERNLNTEAVARLFAQVRWNDGLVGYLRQPDWRKEHESNRKNNADA